MNKINIKIVSDGGNPQSSDKIIKSDNNFLIFPFSEDGDPNYKFRLDVELYNPTNRPVVTQITIEWDDEKYMRYRNYLLITHNEIWQKIPAALEGSRATASITLMPGISHLSMHPPYNTAKLNSLLQTLDPEISTIRSIGKSLHNRDIFAIEMGNRKHRPLLVVSRIHPYETIGSFFCDGMLKYLNSNTDETREILSNHHLVFLPMPNPDGVAEGTCKRTSGGLDLNNAIGSSEPEGIAIKKFIDDIKPQSTFDIHGFMSDEHDLGTSDIKRGKAIKNQLMLKSDLFDKPIHIEERMIPEGGDANIGGYAQTEFNSVRFGGSWIWEDKNADQLHLMGGEIIKAYIAQF